MLRTGDASHLLRGRRKPKVAHALGLRPSGAKRGAARNRGEPEHYVGFFKCYLPYASQKGASSSPACLPPVQGITGTPVSEARF